MTSLFIRGGRVVTDSAATTAHVRILDGIIAEIGSDLSPGPNDQVVEAEGCWVGPGFVDLHTHLREPGKEAAENIESGANAAALGGYSAVVAMPNKIGRAHV